VTDKPTKAQQRTEKLEALLARMPLAVREEVARLKKEIEDLKRAMDPFAAPLFAPPKGTPTTRIFVRKMLHEAGGQYKRLYMPLPYDVELFVGNAPTDTQDWPAGMTLQLPPQKRMYTNFGPDVHVLEVTSNGMSMSRSIFAALPLAANSMLIASGEREFTKDKP